MSFRHGLGPALLLLLLPLSISGIVYAMVHLDGSLSGLLCYIWLHSGWFPPLPLPGGQLIAALAAFLAFQLLLLVILPGQRYRGPVAPSGHVPEYKDNALLSLAATLAAFVAWVPPTFVYDNLGPLVVSLNLLALLLCVALYFKGLHSPSTRDSGSSGNVALDLYWGTELYPRIVGVDLKQFIICRVGMVLWLLFALSFLAKSLQMRADAGEEGLPLAQVVSVTLQSVYIAKFFYWERWYMHAADIAVDRLGFMLCWGTLVFMPVVHTLQNLFLVSHRGLPFSEAGAVAWVLAGVLCTYVNYEADTQRHRVRANPDGALVWGRPPLIIWASYKTADGRMRKNALLASGFTGLARHFHYLPDIVQLCLYTVPAGFSHLLPHTYALYLTVLLVDRTWRIDTKCHAKYGRAWEAYVDLVPWRIIPGVF